MVLQEKSSLENLSLLVYPTRGHWRNSTNYIFHVEHTQQYEYVTIPTKQLLRMREMSRAMIMQVHIT
jgi:hypothetical protein